MRNRRLTQRFANHAEGGAVEVAEVQVVKDSRLVNLGQGAYNPPFNAQFQLQVIPYYFTEAAGVYTSIAAAALNATLKNRLAFFLFGNLDFESGYPLLQSQFPLQNWNYGVPQIYGRSVTPATNGIAWDANVTANLQKGDLVFSYYATAGGTKYVALLVVRSQDVPFGSLLQATQSNMFGLNLIRYVVNSTAAADLAQFTNAIICTDETMFGKISKDSVNPNSFKNPEQMQDQIIDIDFDFKISKQKALSSYFNYDAGALSLQMFVAWATKID